MKVAIIYNKDFSYVINKFGMQNKEIYNEQTVKEIAKALEKGGHNVEIIDGNMNVIESIQNFMPKVLEGEKMGMVFNMAYGIQGESRYTHIPSLLEMIGIPYVGSNPSGHALALDKVITKIIMQKHDIPTPNFWVFSSHEEDMSDVEYPVIIKPKMEAVSFGLKVVYNEKDLREAVKFIIDEFNQQALVEQFIRGREFAIGLIGNNPPEAFPVLEIDLDDNPDAIQSVEDKKTRPRKKICPANLPIELAKEMQDQSMKAFKALQINDFARVDIRLDENGNFYILEINSMASLGPTGSFPFAAKAAGYNYTELVNKMLHVAATRYFGEGYLAEETDSQKKETIYFKVKSYLRNRQEKYEEILKTLVNKNSYVRNTEGVNSMSALIKKYLSQLEFSFQAIPQAEIGNIFFCTNTDNEEYDILLLGHLDNMVKIDEHKYYKQETQKIFGSGVWENKGGIIIMLAALQALKSMKILHKRKLAILLTTDHSLQNKVSASIIRKKATNAKYVLGMAGAFLDGGIVTSRSGAASYSAAINLTDNHAAKNVSSVSGIFTKLINSWINLTNIENGVLVAPSNMQLKSNFHHVACHGTVDMSIRYNHQEHIKDIDTKLKNLVPKKYRDMVDIYLLGGIKRPAMERSEKTEELWSLIKSTANKLDVRLREEHRWSSSDICFIPDDKFKIDGLGPVGFKDENKQEYILRYSLIERAALLAMVIHNIK